MGIDPNALEMIQETAVKAKGLSRWELDWHGVRKCLIYNHATGIYDIVQGDPPPRSHLAYSLDAFRDAVKAFGGASEAGGPKVAVFCGRGLVAALLDEEKTPEARITFELPLADEFKTLQRLRDRRCPLDQRAVIRLLRVDLAGCVAEAIVNAFRNIKFIDHKDGERSAKHGRDAVGMSVIREVTGADSLPEMIEIKVPVYRDLAGEDELRMVVACAVEIDTENGTFTILPLAGELEDARRETDEWIQRWLSTELHETIPVIIGGPGSA